jgi:hypothetical protein
MHALALLLWLKLPAPQAVQIRSLVELPAVLT